MGIGRKPSNSQNSLPRRAYYPSGPWIDGIRPYEAPASNDPPPGNPDPAKYNILAAEEADDYLIVKIHYPNCTNFEGNKILVFKGTTLLTLVNQKLIDPHFFKDKKYAAPIARFIPTDEGWKMAQVFVAGMRTIENQMPVNRVSNHKDDSPKVKV